MFKELEDIIKRVETRIAALFEAGESEHAADLQEVVGAAKKQMAKESDALEAPGAVDQGAKPDGGPALSLAPPVADPAPVLDPSTDQAG